MSRYVSWLVFVAAGCGQAAEAPAPVEAPVTVEAPAVPSEAAPILSSAEDERAKQTSLLAANAWLAQMDQGDYAGSWDAAASSFKATASKTSWASSAAALRGPLGAVSTRAVKSQTVATTLPGAPEGYSVVIQFETSFANKTAAVETVTPMLDDDGNWHVSGYDVK